MKIPLIVSTPESMLKIKVITLKDYLEKTIKVLHKVGVLHIETNDELKPLDRTSVENERNAVNDLLNNVENALSYTSERATVSTGENIEVIYTKPFSELSNEVTPLCNKLNNQHQMLVSKEKEINKLTNIGKYIKPLTNQTELKLKDLNFNGNYLFSRLFLLPHDVDTDLYNQIEKYLFKSVVNTADTGTVMYTIGKVENREIVESLVTKYEGEIIEIPDEELALQEFLKISQNRISDLRLEMEKLKSELQIQINDNLEKLVTLRTILLSERERLLVLEKASEAKYITLIEGWVPESNVDAVIAELKYDLDYLFIDTKEPDPSEEPPSKQRNPGGLKPFQVITNLFSVPKYGEWDPTPIIAYSFALFFGIMLGDVIYALGVLLLAKFLLPMFTDNPESDNFKLFQRVLYTSGVSALIIGLLTGTYLGDMPGKFFGMGSLALVSGIEEIFKSPISFIVMAIVIGLIHVNIGHLMALIGGIKTNDKGTVIGRSGLFIFQFAAIPYIMNSMLGVNISFLNEQAYSLLTYVLLLSVVLIIISSIMIRGKFIGSLFWLFDMTGILGDVMSYARLAGVGLATYYLAFAFNLMAGLFLEMMSGPVGLIVGTVIAVIILLIGHVVNLVLGVLTGFIHSLRLCFVEFLLKFYEGGGREYSPFKLKTRASMVIGSKS
ncbi:V-type ATP synthase subunit I [Chloroflexota bacterium]